MDLQLYNLAFSLITTAGGTAVVTAVLLLVIFRFLDRYWKRIGVSGKNQRAIKRSVWFAWIFIMLVISFIVFHGSGPRITVEDTVHKSPVYNQAGESVQDLNPNQKTDDERVRENEELFRKNLQE